MNKTVKRIIVIAAIAIAVLFCIFSYNSLVSKQESIDNAWGQVETNYQRRADLIPNLVSTVKGYAAHESSTLESVVEARSKAMGIHIDADNLTDAQLAKFQSAQDELGKALGRLIAVSEAYPDLKANQNFLDLQAQLEGTENRINVARMDFNNAVKEYNTFIRKFPSSILASLFGFEKRAYFTAAEGAEEAPKVEF